MVKKASKLNIRKMDPLEYYVFEEDIFEQGLNRGKIQTL